MSKATKQETSKHVPQEVVRVTGGGEVTTEMPDFLKGTAGQGLENVEAGDYAMPRIKLLQGLSPEVEENDNLRPGMFYHTLAEESLGTKLRAVIVYWDKRFVLWRPRPEGGILARADDGVHWIPADTSFEVKLKGKKDPVVWRTADTVARSGLANWGTSDPDDPNSQPAATLVYTFVLALPDFPQYSPSVVLLQRGSIGVGRTMVGKLKIGGVAMYGQVFDMEAYQETSDDGPYQNYKFTRAGFVANKAEFERYQEIHKSFAQNGVKIRDLEDAADEGAVGGSKGGVDPDAANNKGF